MLGVIVEEREYPMFASDFESSRPFSGHPATQAALGPFFDGIIFVEIQPNGDSWVVKQSEVVRW